jgi:farnesol dehydrogenase
MRVLVTGGTGYLGRAIVSALLADGHDPVVFARRASQSGQAATLIDGDIRDRAAVMAAARGCDGVCHAAALVSIWRPDPRDFDAVNVDGLRHVLAAARERGVSRIVYTSSFLALPPAGASAPIQANDYQRTKVRARREALDAADRGQPVVCLYPGVLYGPGVRTEGNLVGRLLADRCAGRLPGVIGPERTWSFSFVNDVAAGHVAALTRPRVDREYALGGENAPQRRIFELLRDRTGLRPPIRIPYALASAIGVAEQWRARLTGHVPLVTPGTVRIFRYDWPIDSGAARADLGFPVTPLAEGFRTLLPELGYPVGQAP